MHLFCCVASCEPKQLTIQWGAKSELSAGYLLCAVYVKHRAFEQWPHTRGHNCSLLHSHWWWNPYIVDETTRFLRDVLRFGWVGGWRVAFAENAQATLGSLGLVVWTCLRMYSWRCSQTPPSIQHFGLQQTIIFLTTIFSDQHNYFLYFHNPFWTSLQLCFLESSQLFFS